MEMFDCEEREIQDSGLQTGCVCVRVCACTQTGYVCVCMRARRWAVCVCVCARMRAHACTRAQACR